MADVQLVGEFETGLQRRVAVTLDTLVNGERDDFDAGVARERVVENLREDDAVFPAGEANQPRLRVLGRGVVGKEEVLADSVAGPLRHGATEVVGTQMQARVRGVHHRVRTALVAGHCGFVACGRG